MTNKQRVALLDKAVRELKLTKDGYDPAGGHWRRAMGPLENLRDSLEPAPKPKPPATVPNLGPLWRGGKSVLLHAPTHKTSGIPLYVAFDDAFVANREIIAPEALVVIPNPDPDGPRQTSSNPGKAFYAIGKSGIIWWFGHLDRHHPFGTKFRKGQFMGNVLDHDIGGGPHVHAGMNVETLLGKGKQLKYGRTGNGPDYTWGSPTVGDQLAKALA